MKILLIGKDGQIGKSLLNVLRDEHEVIPLGKKDCNLQNKEEIILVFKNLKVDLVIIAAAYTNVEKAENESDKAFSINSHSIETIAILTKQYNIPIIYYSTDYVFDGKSSKEYSEEDNLNPINIYGKSKLSGEKNVRINKKFIIIRTSRVFSDSKNNFITKIINLAKKEENLSIVSDEIATPTSSDLISKVTHKLINYMNKYKNKNIFGVYHVVAEGSCSWYDYCTLIVDELLKNKFSIKINLNNISSITSKNYKTNAIRPKNSVLSNKKIKKLLSIELPNWEDDVKKSIKDIINKK